MTTSKVKTKKPLQKMTKDELIKEINRQKKIKNKINEDYREVITSGLYEKKMNIMLSESNKLANVLREDYIDAFKHQREMEKTRLEIKKSKIKQKEIGLQFLGQTISPILGLIINELSASKCESTAVNTKKSTK